MNLPNSTEDNWSWRFGDDDLTDAHGERLRDMTETYGRVRRHEVESMKLDQDTSEKNRTTGQPVALAHE
jgi:hypothetical protein